MAEQPKTADEIKAFVADQDIRYASMVPTAAAELLRLAFEDLGVRRVVAQCFADNTPSWRLMERLGMRRESSTRAASLHRSGRWLDGVGYGILAEEWRRRADA